MSNRFERKLDFGKLDRSPRQLDRLTVEPALGVENNLVRVGREQRPIIVFATVGLSLKPIRPSRSGSAVDRQLSCGPSVRV